jgi:hypothetical protein
MRRSRNRLAGDPCRATLLHVFVLSITRFTMPDAASLLLGKVARFVQAANVVIQGLPLVAVPVAQAALDDLVAQSYVLEHLAATQITHDA